MYCKQKSTRRNTDCIPLSQVITMEVYLERPEGLWHRRPVSQMESAAPKTLGFPGQNYPNTKLCLLFLTM